MPSWINVSGCAVEEDSVYVAQCHDPNKSDSDATRAIAYDPRRKPPWMTHDLPRKAVCVCVWRNGPYSERVCVSLARRGEVEILGPSGTPRIVEKVPLPTVDGQGNRFVRSMMSIRQIGDRLYACGAGYLTFRRGADTWDDFTAAIDRDTNRSQFYFDINGPGEGDLFAVGMNNPGRSRVAHFDGTRWATLDDTMPNTLTCIEPSLRGGVYLGGWGGTLLYGDRSRGFTRRAHGLPDANITDLREFNGRLYIASTHGFFVYDHDQDAFQYVNLDVEPLPRRNINRLDSIGGTLWAFASSDILFSDGTSWTRLPMPRAPQPLP